MTLVFVQLFHWSFAHCCSKKIVMQPPDLGGLPGYPESSPVWSSAKCTMHNAQWKRDFQKLKIFGLPMSQHKCWCIGFNSSSSLGRDECFKPVERLEIVRRCKKLFAKWKWQTETRFFKLEAGASMRQILIWYQVVLWVFYFFWKLFNYSVVVKKYSKIKVKVSDKKNVVPWVCDSHKLYPLLYYNSIEWSFLCSYVVDFTWISVLNNLYCLLYFLESFLSCFQKVLNT